MVIFILYWLPGMAVALMTDMELAKLTSQLTHMSYCTNAFVETVTINLIFCYSDPRIDCKVRGLQSSLDHLDQAPFMYSWCIPFCKAAVAGVRDFWFFRFGLPQIGGKPPPVPPVCLRTCSESVQRESVQAS